MTIILTPEGVFTECGHPIKEVFDEFGKPFKEISKEEFIKSLKESSMHHKKLIEDVEEFLSFYFTANQAIDLSSMDEWIEKNPINDKWFLIHLIEIAGQKFLDGSVKSHFSSAGTRGGKAKNKSKEELKEWARQQPESLNLQISPAAAADKLFGKIPPNLRYESTNARLLMERAIRASRKTNPSR